MDVLLSILVFIFGLTVGTITTDPYVSGHDAPQADIQPYPPAVATTSEWGDYL